MEISQTEIRRSLTSPLFLVTINSRQNSPRALREFFFEIRDYLKNLVEHFDPLVNIVSEEFSLIRLMTFMSIFLIFVQFYQDVSLIAARYFDLVPTGLKNLRVFVKSYLTFVLLLIFLVFVVPKLSIFEKREKSKLLIKESVLFKQVTLAHDFTSSQMNYHHRLISFKLLLCMERVLELGFHSCWDC